jgi:hypothetical protein
MIDPKIFRNPSPQYRAAPFWSWNHTLTPERLLEQVGSMYEQGLGGYYMHARIGLKTEYFGKEFEEAIEACVKESERLGIFADLYDEDTFPSGNASGMVTRGHPEFAARCIALRECKPGGAADSTSTGGAADNAASNDTADHAAFGGAADYTAPDGKSYYFEEVTSPDSPRWGSPSPDTLSKAAMSRYIKITYDWYKERFGKYFGADFSNVVPTIFADEPSIPSRFGRYSSDGVIASIPWSSCFRDEFLARKGYDIQPELAKMFFDIPGCEKIRFDFYDVSFNLFMEAFTKQIFEWCAINNIDFTCHYWEHNYPLTVMQGDVMAHYEYMQIPGIDMLFNLSEEDEHEQFGFDLIVKEVSSAAAQTGKKRVMSETHGAGGWDVSFKDQKRMLDWQFALGVNYIVPHLFYLSMQGDRKRDFPLSFNNEPWWGEYRVLADYIGRVSYVLSEGDFLADTMLLHNYSTTYAAYSPTGDNKELLELGEETRDTATALSFGQVYYNLGSENLLAKYGRAEDGKICIGGMGYKYLVIPPSVTIASATLPLLRAFKAQGGYIVCTGRKPEMVDGVKSGELISLLSDVETAAIGDVAGVLKARGAAGLRLTPVGEASKANMRSVYAHERLLDGNRLLFICNISRYDPVEFLLPAAGLVSEYDCVTGEIRELPYDGDNLRVYLHQCGSACYIIDAAAPALRPTEVGAPAPSARISGYSGSSASFAMILNSVKYTDFKVSRGQDNMLAINSCTASLEDGWSAGGTATSVDIKLKEHISRGAPLNRRQPWTYTEEEKAVKTALSAQYVFNVEGDITRLRVAAEYPDEFSVSLNGIKLTADGWFIDRDIVCYPAAHAVRKGKNVITLDGLYNIETSLESVYLIGDFTVECASAGASARIEDDD